MSTSEAFLYYYPNRPSVKIQQRRKRRFRITLPSTYYTVHYRGYQATYSHHRVAGRVPAHQYFLFVGFPSRHSMIGPATNFRLLGPGFSGAVAHTSRIIPSDWPGQHNNVLRRYSRTLRGLHFLFIEARCGEKRRPLLNSAANARV